MVGLSALGIAFIHSATSAGSEGVAAMSPARMLSPLAWRQAQWLLVSLAAFTVVVALDYSLWRRWSYVLYALTLIALIVLLERGTTRGGSQRWFRVGPFTVQPSEFMKVAVILALARYLMFRKNYRRLAGLAYPFLFALAPMLLILKQPDLGTSLVFLPVLFAMLYVAGARPKHLGAVVAAGFACAPLVWFGYMSARQKARVTAFLNPRADPSGDGYQLIESLIAIGTGGLTGKGYMQGSQNLLRKVPAGHTDFIFAAVCEEWGFIGGALVIGLYVVLFYSMCRMAARTREPFGRLVVVGSATMLAFQAVVNVGMTVRLCPITGITLPFVSYGGSSLLTCFVVSGLVFGIGLRPKIVMAPSDDLA